MEARNLILCGYMGSGKSSAGPPLAEKTGLRFVDLDDHVVARKGMSVNEIFRLEGEEGFRDAEHEALRDLLRREGHVIALGGGTLSYERNIALFGERDRILLLDPGFDVCYRRIKNSDRPLVRRHSREELRAIYEERMRLYRRVAHIVVPIGKQPPETADNAVRLLNS